MICTRRRGIIPWIRKVSGLGAHSNKSKVFGISLLKDVTSKSLNLSILRAASVYLGIGGGGPSWYCVGNGTAGWGLGEGIGYTCDIFPSHFP